GCSVLAYAWMRRMNSAGVAASRRSTDASWKPPSMKWVWPSVKPGMTRPPRTRTMAVWGPTYRATAADSPTAAIFPRAIATAPGRGAPCDSPVQSTPPVTTRSALPPHAARDRHNTPAARLRIIGASSAEFGDAMNGFERGDRIRRPRLVAAACGAGRGARRERVADIEQYLEQELLALVRGVEVRHAGLVAGGLRTSPLGTFGTKYVDLGGMTSPASATANTSSTLVGLRRTAAAALPVRTASNAARGSGV